MNSTTTTTDLIADARQAFVTAVRAGQNGAAEHRAWCQATAAAIAEGNRATHAFDDYHAARLAEFNRLRVEARTLGQLAKVAGGDANQGSTTKGGHYYSAAEHEAAVSRWLAEASAWLGEPVAVLAMDALPIPPLPRGEDRPPIPSIPAVPDYAAAVQLAVS